jgi:hypothetical protein
MLRSVGIFVLQSLWLTLLTWHPIFVGGRAASSPPSTTAGILAIVGAGRILPDLLVSFPLQIMVIP